MRNALVLVVALALAPACKKGGGSPKVCRDYVAAAEKLSNCAQLSADVRGQVKEQVDQMKKALDLLDALSADEAEKEIKEMEQICKAQLEQVEPALAQCK